MTGLPTLGPAIVLAYGPRGTAQPCLKCGRTVPASDTPDFGYETDDDTAQPLCELCVALHMTADWSALQVLRVIAEATTKAKNSRDAIDFLWQIESGVELLEQDLEDQDR